MAAAHWTKNPTKKQLISAIVFWCVGIFLSTATATDMFRASPFIRRNIIPLLLWVFATYTVISVCKNYFRNRRLSETK